MKQLALLAAGALALAPFSAAQNRASAPAKDPFPRPAPTAPGIGSVRPQTLAAATINGSDSCAAPDLISGNGVFTFDNTLATTGAEGQTEVPCTFFGSTAIIQDVWFAWTATATGVTTLTTCGIGVVDSKIAVYDGAGCPSGPAIACNDDACAGFQSTVSFGAVAGQTYTVQIGMYPLGGAVAGADVFSITTAPPATGPDSCNSPTVISGVGTFPFDNTTATTGLEGQANGICNLVGGGTAILQDLWYTWTAPSSGLARVNTCGVSVIDTKIAIYNGSGCPAAAAIACNDDACTGYQSTVDFPCTAGSVYTIQLGLYPGTAPAATPGAGVFDISILVPPANDACATPVAIAGSGPFPFDNSVATTGAQGQAEVLCTQAGGQGTAVQKDLWYTWVAPSTAVYRVVTCLTTTIDSKIAVYAGAGCPAAAALACNDDDCGIQTRTLFNAVQGQSYTIQLGLFAGSTTGGSGTFSFEVVPAPPSNDECTGAVALSGPGPHTYDTSNCTTGVVGQTEGLCLFFGSTTVRNDQWFLWTATTNGSATLTTCGGTGTGASEDTKVGIYLGPNCPTPGSAVACNEDDGACGAFGFPSTVTWTVSCGQSYLIQMGRYPFETNPVFGTFTITEAGAPCVAATPYCFGDGSGTACPCGNAGVAGNGCGSSVNAAGGNLAATGSASITTDTVVLQGTGMANSNALYFQGTTRLNAGAGAVFGDGLRCAGGSIIRLGTKTNVAGASAYPGAADQRISVRGLITAPGTRTYQSWYRNAAAFCTASTFNLTNGLEIPWAP